MTAALIDLALGLAVVLVVPLALRLDRRRPVAAVHLRLALALGLTAAFSFVIGDEGVLPAALATPWAAFTVWVALRHVLPLDLRSLQRDAVHVVPFAYLVTGAGWLVISRYGGHPLDFGDTIVELTAVHFHYAGFVAPILVLQLGEWLRAHERGVRAVRLAHAAVVAATPLTAAGITLEPALGAAGAALFAAGLLAYALLTLRWVVPRVGALEKVSLTTSSLSVVAAMVLALAYALGQWVHTPAPSLTAMVRTHGLLNAVGFALAGVLGWLWQQRRGAPGGAPL